MSGAEDRHAAHHEHTKRRLETFSDIVIAFTLSQFALTLKLPAHSLDLVAHPIGVFLFLSSFVLVAGLWWLHHRLFSRYFYPDTASILLNFAFLATTVYVAYSFLLLTTIGDMLSLAAYMSTVGGAYSILALLVFKGLRDPRIGLDETERRDGFQLALRVILAGGSFLVAGVLAMLKVNPRAVLIVPIAAVVVVAALGIRSRLQRSSTI